LSAERPRVLVVDDKTSVTANLKHNLTLGGFEVITANTTALALQYAQITPFRFAVIDLKLAGADDYGGIKLATEIMTQQPQIQPIFLSAWKEDDVQSHLASAGIRSYGYVWKGDARSNYIDAVLAQLKTLQANRPRRRCLVIMPFSSTNACKEEEWRVIFDEVLKPAVESVSDFVCERVNVRTGIIAEEVVVGLQCAEVVIADLTDARPNVLYELGIRHALRDTTILIVQDPKHLPSDLAANGTITYGWRSHRDREQLRSNLKEVLETLTSRPAATESPVRKYLRQPTRSS
jgi:CheY-like chemotaxis protein